MKLDRNINSDGRGKYALMKLRKLDEITELNRRATEAALKLLEHLGIVDYGRAGTEAEFMLIRLKDKYAQPALQAYAMAAVKDDPEFAAEILEMATRAGPASPFCKKPD